MATQAMVTVEGLNKRFQNHRVIDNLSFRIGYGERMAIFAPSGAGKSTLIKILTGVEKADSGRILLTNVEPVTLFQEPRLFPFLTVQENIFMPFKVKRAIITTDVQNRYRDWLEVCELTGFSTHYPYQLSGGMRQKVALIRGFLGEPSFVMLDEPFQSINSLAKQDIIAHILKTAPKISILLVTHIPEEIPWLVQTVLYFQNPCLRNPEWLNVEQLQQKLGRSTSFFNTIESNPSFA